MKMDQKLCLRLVNLLEILESSSETSGGNECCCDCAGVYDGRNRKVAKIVHRPDCELKNCLDELRKIKSNCIT